MSKKSILLKDSWIDLESLLNLVEYMGKHLIYMLIMVLEISLKHIAELHLFMVLFLSYIQKYK